MKLLKMNILGRKTLASLDKPILIAVCKEKFKNNFFLLCKRKLLFLFYFIARFLIFFSLSIFLTANCISVFQYICLFDRLTDSLFSVTLFHRKFRIIIKF